MQGLRSLAMIYVDNGCYRGKVYKIVPFDKYIAEVIDMKIALIGYGYWGLILLKIYILIRI